MKQSDLVRATGIRPNTVCDLFNEFATRISLDNLEAICETLNCDIVDVLEYVPRKKAGEALKEAVTLNLTRREAEVVVRFREREAQRAASG